MVSSCEALSQSDHVVLVVPLLDVTRSLLNEASFWLATCKFRAPAPVSVNPSTLSLLIERAATGLKVQPGSGMLNVASP